MNWIQEFNGLSRTVLKIFSFSLGISYRLLIKYDMNSIHTATVNNGPQEVMPIVCQINRSKDLTVFTWTGQVMFSELTDFLNTYGKAGPALHEIYDIRELAGERLSTVEIERIVGYCNRFGSNRPEDSKTAVVVREDIDFSISKTIALLILIDGVVPYQINVFRVMDEAIRWLDLEVDKDDPDLVALNCMDGNKPLRV